MNEPLALLDMDLPCLEQVRDMLAWRVSQGLAADGLEIAAIPSWTPPPPPDLEGLALVLDVGGTNMRAALVELQAGGQARVVAGPTRAPVPDGRNGRSVSAAAFFDAQAELTRDLDVPPGTPVGYCFSYPARTLPDGDAVLLHWTKGIRIPDVEGEGVGLALLQALRRQGLQPGPVRVINDTVAALMAGARIAASLGREESIGLIVGTGTNMATFLPVARIPKLGASAAGWRGMAVNLESGNFRPPHLSEWDELVDDDTDNPGRQRFEKAVSGFYLPFLFRKLVPDFKSAVDARLLGELRTGGDFPSRAAAALLDRSADLVAAALAGLVDCLPPNHRVAILAEGSLVALAPGYRERVQARLEALLGSGRALLCEGMEPNLVGTASAAICGRVAPSC